jgi:hypothetical protein
VSTPAFIVTTAGNVLRYPSRSFVRRVDLGDLPKQLIQAIAARDHWHREGFAAAACDEKIAAVKASIAAALGVQPGSVGHTFERRPAEYVVETD